MRVECSCSRPIRDSAFLCRECTKTVEKHLAEVPALAADLETTRTRTSRTGGASIGIVVRSSDRPVPWDDRASRLAKQLHAHLSRWVLRCRSELPPPPGPICSGCAHQSCVQLRSRARAHRAPAFSAGSMSSYLLAVLPALRHRPEVTALADELDALVKRVDKVIDRPPELTFFGPCGAIDYWPGTDDPILCAARCPADLYGEPGSTELTCTTCGAVHDVTALRKVLMSEAQDQLVTAADLSRFLTAYGEPLTADRIRKWASRGLLLAHGKDPAGRPLYRVSEAADRLSQMAQRRSAA